MIKLYDVERSGSCYKIGLTLSLLGIEYRLARYALSEHTVERVISTVNRLTELDSARELSDSLVPQA